MTYSSFLSTASSIPSLRLRKDIWTHFPVCLVKIPASNITDGRDRYRVQWHKKNLAEWNHCAPGCESKLRPRLLEALVSSDRWTVEYSKTNTDICVIAMNFSAEPTIAEDLPKFSLDMPADMSADQYMINFVDDLKNYFPIVWKRSGSQTTLEFHNTQVRALAQKLSVTEAELRRDVLLKMIPILERKWNVVMTNKIAGSEICTLSE